MAKALPVLPFDLDQIDIASPCSADWNDMVGGERVRFCGSCQKNVYNLTAMPRPAAMELLRATEGKVCVRFYRRADGTILTQDCPVGVAAALKRAKRHAKAGIAVAVGAFAACLAVVGGSLTKKTCASLQNVQQSLIETQPMTTGGAVAVPNPDRGQWAAGGPRAPVRPTMGEAQAPPAPREIMGKMAAPQREPQMLMGDVALPEPATP